MMCSVPAVIYSFRTGVDGSLQILYAPSDLRHQSGVKPSAGDNDAGPILARIHPDDIGCVRDSIAASARTMSPWRGDFRLGDALVGEIWIEGHFLPEAEGDGAITWHGYLHDVTERKMRDRHSLSLLRAALESTADGLLVVDDKGRFTIYNQRFAELWRIPAAVLERGDDDEAMHHVLDQLAEPKQFLDKVHQLYSDPRESSFDVLSFKDGRVFERYSQAQMVGTAIVGRVWSFRDVSDRVRAEQALRDREETLRRAQAVAQTGSWHLDLVSGYLEWSDEMHKIFRVAPGHTATIERLLPLVHPEDVPALRAAWAAALRGEPFDVEHRLLIRGEVRWIRERAEIGRASDGTPLAATGTAQDITERKRSEEALRLSEERFQLAMRGASDGLWDWNLRTGEVYYSPRWKSMLGFAEDELGHTIDTWENLMDPGDLAATLALVSDVVGGRAEKFEMEFRVRHKDGHYLDILSRAFLSSVPDGVQRLVGTHVDISERKLAERRVRDSEERYRSLVETTFDWIWEVNEDLEYTYVSPRVHDFLGYEPHEVMERRPFDFMLQDQAERLRSLLTDPATARQPFAGLEIVNLHRDGRSVILETSGLPVFGPEGEFRGYRGAHRDVTERRRATQALRDREQAQLRSQKLEALGTLAGGIAHDFNNLLAIISGNVRLAAEDLPDGHSAHVSLREISQAATRATELVRGILVFGRPHEPRLSTVDLGTVVADALRLLRATLPTMIALPLRCERGLPPIRADVTQIHQVVMNLATNAAHAIGQREGRVAFCIDGVESGDSHDVPGLHPGCWVRLTVSDDGQGMDHETLERIFDPFFTTKPSGVGTGLGLSIVHSIVKKCGGVVTVDSDIGAGSVFQLFFPTAEEALTTPRSPEPQGLLATLSRGGAHVLYVDDEEALVFLLERVLVRMGYTVAAYTQPVEALRDFHARPLAFDLVVTDLSMPGTNGFELAREVLEVRPDIPVLMMSGNVSVEDEERAKQVGIRKILLKPDTVEHLAAAIDRLRTEEIA